jgi:hypothetical protein
MNFTRAPSKSLATLLACCLATSVVTPAHAVGYVNDKDGWMALTPESKAAYVQGLNDSLNYVFVDDTLTNAMAKKGRTECLVALQTSSSLLADRITYAYTKDKNMAGYAPTAVYIIKMGELCRSYINRERAAYGLGPQ